MSDDWSDDELWDSVLKLGDDMDKDEEEEKSKETQFNYGDLYESIDMEEKQ